MFGLARRLLLAASTNSWLRERATKAEFVRRSVSAFMPGERLEDGMAAAAEQSKVGLTALLTRLGENLASEADAEEVTNHYLDALERIAASRLPSQISVKPTQLGLDLRFELCLSNLQRLVDRADHLGNFVWVDMESSAYVERTLDLFRAARARSPRTGIALQAYLRRTEADLDSLLPLAASVRLVKGAYLEPSSVAFPRKSDVDASYLALASRVLRDDGTAPGRIVQLATHDERLVTRLEALIKERSIPASSYEFAMLYGIQRPLQARLIAAGHSVRTLISYGDYWFPWYMRRLAERPANVWFVLKHLFAG